jgi:hypothetical protein
MSVVAIYSCPLALHQKESVYRIHQYARCLEGPTVPPVRGGTGKNFAYRMALFVGAAHVSRFKKLYKLGGEIEHPHENKYWESFDRAMRLELWKDACILNHTARTCIARILATPTLWPHFRIGKPFGRSLNPSNRLFGDRPGWARRGPDQ